MLNHFNGHVKANYGARQHVPGPSIDNVFTREKLLKRADLVLLSLRINVQGRSKMKILYIIGSHLLTSIHRTCHFSGKLDWTIYSSISAISNVVQLHQKFKFETRIRPFYYC